MIGTVSALVTVLLVALGPPESLQTARPQLPPKLRDAEQVIDDFTRALGGVEAWSRHKSYRIKRNIEVKGMQIGGTEERYGTSAGKTLSVTAIKGLGSFRQGSDGKAAWSQDPINGLRVLEGVEAEEAKVDATWNADLQLKKLYQKVRSVQPPEPPPAGRRYECVELVPKLAKPAIACFDADTHLRVFQKGTRSSPQGEVPYKVIFSDWRDVQGMKLAYAEEMTAGPMTLIAQVTEVKLDPKLDPKLFDIPKVAQPGAKKDTTAGKPDVNVPRARKN